MLVLVETPAGYALFRILNEKKFAKIENLNDFFQDEQKLQKYVQLEAFHAFKDTTDALKATSKLIKGKIPVSLSKFLKKNVISQEVQENLEVADKKLSKSIQDKLQITFSPPNIDLSRLLRSQLDTLISGLTSDDLRRMTLGLAHGLSRYKLQFSVEKVDTMIVQAIALLDDLDKEINNFMMRLREWYGWHFPELSKIISDNHVYAKTVQKIGKKTNTPTLDFEGVLPEDVEKEVRQAAEISMGTEINDEDEKYILELAEQIIGLGEYRESLNEYLTNRMQAIAPNLSQMVGEVVAARLIAHAGSIINLAKFPASTVQILGAEKALFKAIKTKTKTPKYGILYQASLVGQAQTRIKGKISRALAAKCSLCSRCDALGEAEDASIGNSCKSYIQKRIAFLEANETNKGYQKPNKESAKFQPASGFNIKNDIQFKKAGETETLKRFGQSLEGGETSKKFKAQ